MGAGELAQRPGRGVVGQRHVAVRQEGRQRVGIHEVDRGPHALGQPDGLLRGGASRPRGYYTTILDQPGAALQVLQLLQDTGINQLAMFVIPVGPNVTELAIFPEDAARFVKVAQDAQLPLFGPHQAILIQGPDAIGALVDAHVRLGDAGVNIYSSTAVTGGHGHFGMLIHVKSEDIARAREALGVR